MITTEPWAVSRNSTSSVTGQEVMALELVFLKKIPKTENKLTND